MTLMSLIIQNEIYRPYVQISHYLQYQYDIVKVMLVMSNVVCVLLTGID